MCIGENKTNLLCGLCIITVLLGLGVTLIILGQALDIIDLTILGSIFLGFEIFLTACVVVMIARPLYNSRKIGYSSTDLKSNGLMKQESVYGDQLDGIHIQDDHTAEIDRRTVSSVTLHVRPMSTDSKTSELFRVNSRLSTVSSNGPLVTELDQNRELLISENEQTKNAEASLMHASICKSKHVAFETENKAVTKF